MRSPLNSLTFYDPSTRVWRGTLAPPRYDPHQSLGGVVLSALDRFPEKIAEINVESETRLTFGEMKLRTVRMAQNLTSLGYNETDTCTLVTLNSDHVAPLVYACLTLGITINPLEVSLPSIGFVHMLKTVKPSVVFCEQRSLQEVEAAMSMIDLSVEVFVIGERVEGYKHVEDLLVETGEEDQFVPTDLEDAANRVAVILSSSGSTGPSKAVCLSHAACIANMVGLFEFHPDEIVLYFSSMYWLSGFATLISAVVAGSTQVMTRSPFSPEHILSIIEKYMVTWFFLVPEHLRSVINHPKASQTDLSSIKRCLSGAAYVSCELKRNTELLIPGVDFMIAYGFTELAGVIAIAEKGYYKEGSTGILNFYCQAKIVDDTGKALAIGESGELLVKSDYTFLRYENNQQTTEETMDSNGWLHTGDIAWFDEDGFLFLIDRKKDIIRSNGHIISPSEIENVIQAIPGVVVVCVAAITLDCGLDVPTAFVTKSDESQLDEEHIKRVVAQKLPSFCELRGGIHFVKRIPFTMTGKKHRAECRKLLQKNAEIRK
ncbi:uncharacterized protein LOC129739604 [Uranotaenia lowii]|uniref:uncharacterized protein LOC129739604 n=1 Tax=Uranotaenia lowii TaxID=190385 RepID=UPI002479A18D|nr:uncharacterized protein LOC129739604 [Uranotaenia lowii]